MPILTQGLRNNSDLFIAYEFCLSLSKDEKGCDEEMWGGQPQTHLCIILLTDSCVHERKLHAPLSAWLD